MSGWDDTPVAGNSSWNDGTEGGFKADDTPFKADDSGFAADASETFGGAAPSFGDSNDAGAAGGDDDRACRICHKTDGHLARDCPDKDSMMECYNCGQTGHAKADCTNEKVQRPFDGTCKLCNQEGHRASDCKAPRTELFNDAAEMSIEEAWTLMKKADEVKNLDDFRLAFNAYCLANAKLANEAKEKGETTHETKAVDLENAFRNEGFNVYMIAKDKQIDQQYTFVSVSGEIGQKYLLTFAFSDKPKRAIFAKGWPADAAENLARLQSAGFQIASGIPKCDNCDQHGHVRKSCPQDRVEKTHEVAKLKCVICESETHRARDCDNRPAPKVREPRLCRVCQSEDHISKDCTVMVCRNCDAVDSHETKACDKKKDWTRIRCRECGENGHGAARCPLKAAAAEAGGDGGFGGDTNNGGDGGFGGDTGMGGTGGFEEAATNAGGASGGWEDSDANAGVSLETSGGW